MGVVRSWTLLWLAGGEVSGSQHHKPSGSNCSGFSMLVGSRLSVSHLMGISISGAWTYWGSGSLCLSTEGIQQSGRQRRSRLINIGRLWGTVVGRWEGLLQLSSLKSNPIKNIFFWLMGSYFLNHGLNLSVWQCEYWVLTTGLTGNFPQFHFWCLTIDTF